MGVSHGEALLTKMSERKLGEAVGSWVLLAAMPLYSNLVLAKPHRLHEPWN